MNLICQTNKETIGKGVGYCVKFGVSTLLGAGMCLPLLLPAIVFIGFVSQKADYVWHGLRYPTTFSYRYAFLFSFLLIIMAHDALNDLQLKTDTLKFGWKGSL